MPLFNANPDVPTGLTYNDMTDAEMNANSFIQTSFWANEKAPYTHISIANQSLDKWIII